MRKNKIITFILIFTITWIFSQEKFINANKLNIRESPNQNSKIITQVKRNEKVIILEEKNDWTKISFDNKIGFVSSKYLSDLPLNIEKNNSGFAYGFDKTFMLSLIHI